MRSRLEIVLSSVRSSGGLAVEHIAKFRTQILQIEQELSLRRDRAGGFQSTRCTDHPFAALSHRLPGEAIDDG